MKTSKSIRFLDGTMLKIIAMVSMATPPLIYEAIITQIPSE